MTGFSNWVQRIYLNALRIEEWPFAVRYLLGGLIILLLLTSISSSLVLWPKGDEADYLLQARYIAEGQLPYRDFFVFMTPLGQIITACLIKLMGVDVLGIRLVILTFWAIEWLMLYRLARIVMTVSWSVLLLGFLWAADSRYLVDQHHFWSGFFALASVYQLSRWLLGDKTQPSRLVFSGLFVSATFWTTQSLGVTLATALVIFSIWETIFSQFEKKSVKAILTDWWSTWGRYAVLPAFVSSALIVFLFLALGIWDEFWRDTTCWLSQGHYTQTTIISPWSTMGDELGKTIKPLIEMGIPWSQKLLFLPRVFIALLVAAIFIMPVPVLFWSIYRICQRIKNMFTLVRSHSQTQQNQDCLLMLWSCAAVAMTLSTFTYATTMHIASNSGLVYLLAFMGVAKIFTKMRWQFYRFASQVFLCGFYVAVWIGVCIGCWMHFSFGQWLPAFRPMAGPTLFVDGSEKARMMIAILNVANQAAETGGSVLVLYQSPELYLAGDFRNPSRFSLILPYYTSDAQVSEIIQNLQQAPPAYVIDDHTMYGLSHDPRFSRYAFQTFDILHIPRIDAWLNRNCKVALRNSYFTVYQRY